MKALINMSFILGLTKKQQQNIVKMREQLDFLIKRLGFKPSEAISYFEEVSANWFDAQLLKPKIKLEI